MAQSRRHSGKRFLQRSWLKFKAYSATAYYCRLLALGCMSTQIASLAFVGLSLTAIGMRISFDEPTTGYVLLCVGVFFLFLFWRAATVMIGKEREFEQEEEARLRRRKVKFGRVETVSLPTTSELVQKASELVQKVPGQVQEVGLTETCAV